MSPLDDDQRPSITRAPLLEEGVAEAQLELKNRALAVASEGVTIADARLPDMPLIYANEGFERITGYTVSEVLGKNCRFLQGPRTEVKAAEEIRSAIREQRACVVEILNYRKDGSTFWNRLSITPVRDAAGVLTHFIGVQSDVSARRDAEEALRELNLRLEDANRRMVNDLEAAARIQQSLLPVELPQLAGARLAWSFRPCDQLAGDMLNVIPLDEQRLGLYIIDVSGHGVRAALLSVTLSHTLSAVKSRSCLFTPTMEGDASYVPSPPAQVARRLNRQFQMDPRRVQYFTMMYGVLDRRTWEFRYVSTGHPAAVLMPRRGDARLLPAEGFPVGLMADSSYDEHTVQLQPGDRLYLYTDGLIEASGGREDGVEFGQERLLAALVADRRQTLENCVQRVLLRLDEWSAGKVPSDDVSLLALERLP